jgi:Carbohydrate esterase, sialic acid-specific acetylesterase
MNRIRIIVIASIVFAFLVFTGKAEDKPIDRSTGITPPKASSDVAVTAGPSTELRAGKHLFILSGQSNMAHMSPEGSFIPAVEKAFGKENVTVVKNAKGGAPIRGWYDLTESPAKKRSADGKGVIGDLYNALMNDVKAATASNNYDTVTFVWMQGETDADWVTGPDRYADSFKGILAQLKSDLKLESIDFVIGRISDAKSDVPSWVKIREVQVKLAEDDPHGAWINTDDLNDRVDKKTGEKVNDTHYNGKGLKILGERFAEKAIGLIEKQKSVKKIEEPAEVMPL